MLHRKKKPRITKADTQRAHAGRRALERFGIMFGPISQKEAIRQIQSGEAQFLHRTSNRVSVWIVDIQNKKLEVVYDKQRKTIVTILPGEE